MHTNKRNGEIDFLRFVFSLIIVIFHTFHYDSIFGVHPFIGGNVCVEFFFLVSGFLMAESASRIHTGGQGLGKTTKDFLFRKIKGLFPEFAAAWVIGFVVMHLAEKSFSLGKIAKDFLTGIWELFFLRMSGLTDYRVNVVTWYISAMLLAMLILYPLLVRYRDTFLYIIAPCISIFLIGYMCKAYGSLGGGTDWQGFYYKGFMRALADLSLGCILWSVCQRIKRYEYTLGARILFAVTEFLGYGFCIYWMFGHKDSKMTFVLLMLFAVCLPITFSHKSVASDLFDNRFCYFLGKISLSLYVGHIYWIKSIEKFFPDEPFEKQLLLIAICITVNTAVLVLVSDLIRKHMPGIAGRFRSLMIKE